MHNKSTRALIYSDLRLQRSDFALLLLFRMVHYSLKITYGLHKNCVDRFDIIFDSRVYRILVPFWAWEIDSHQIRKQRRVGDSNPWVLYSRIDGQCASWISTFYCVVDPWLDNSVFPGNVHDPLNKCTYAWFHVMRRDYNGQRTAIQFPNYDVCRN